MAKLRLTKSELKKEKESLKRFNRYLPTLILKKQQLQSEISRILNNVEDVRDQAETIRGSIDEWIAVFGEDCGIDDIVKEKKVFTETGNIAGIDIPIFKSLDIITAKYDPMETPLWVDEGIEALKDYMTFVAWLNILNEQLRLVQDELTITTQRVNLFEKVKIPETKENIRKIQIFLGDLQTAAVVTGKIAKGKIQKRETEKAVS
jgi:V/A-type H+/Na+-transporting ATPase subunit D